MGIMQRMTELINQKKHLNVWQIEIKFVLLRRSSFNSMTVYPSITSLYGLFSCPAVDVTIRCTNPVMRL